MSASEDVLRARFRRLMFCYPRDYRRSDDLLSTMVEAAGEGRTRPTVREAANLVGHGLRARVGRPVSRTVLVWVLLASVLGGVFGGLAGWWAAGPRLDPATAETVLGQVAPGSAFGYQKVAPNVVAADSGERSVPPGMADRLRAEGWTVGGGGDVVTASRGRLTIRAEVRSILTVEITRSASWTRWPVGLAGGLFASVCTFLVVAWASRRTGAAPTPVRVVVNVFFGLAMALLGTSLLGALPLGEPADGVPLVGLLEMWMLSVVGASAGLAALSLATMPKRVTA